MNTFIGFFAIGFAFLSTSALGAESARTPHVQVEIRSETKSLQPGIENWIGVRFEMIKHWHIYWKNPGDSGLPTRVQWTLPEGWEISETYWPIPSRIEMLPLFNFGYEGDILLGFKVKIPKGVFGKKEISAKVSWLVCKESCIPEKAELNFTAEVSPNPPVRNPWAVTFDRLRSEQPQKNELQSKVSMDPENLHLTLNGDLKNFSGKKISFFPYDSQMIKASAPQIIEGSNKIELLLAKSDQFSAEMKSLRGILTSELQGLKQSIEIDIPLSSLSPAPKAAVPVEKKMNIAELFLSSLFAFLGGLILNLMPCVFPVLGIKVMSLVKHHGATKRRHGEVYALGVLCSFWILTGILLSLRSAGQSVGWGFQLQQPGFVISLIFLFSIMSANLAGLFEFGGRWMGAGSALAAKDGYTGTFFTGVLAVIVATPCTAPFMGAAIGAALSQPAWGVFLIFTLLGFGLAFPFLLLSFQPRLLKFLPRPGAWMERLKQLFAIPMLLTVVWLVWVIQQQLGTPATHRILWALLALFFALVIHKKSLGQGGKLLGIVFFVSALSLAFSALQMKELVKVEITGAWESYSEEKLTQARKIGRPIFIDFTAAWCLTCQVNERVVLEKSTMKQFFKDNNVLLLKGDWTNNDPLITAALEHYGRIGVPLYIVYSKGNPEPKVLPQILTEKVVVESF